MAEYLGMFQQQTFVDPLLEVLFGDEPVILSINFSFAFRPGRHRNAKVNIIELLEDLFANRALADT
jgi:hypothetical protein